MRGILVAVSPEGIIGKDNTIPWHYSADLKRFKRLTTDNTIIMGRKTWESLPIKPLPNRRNIVITRSSIKDIECFQSIDEALQTCEGDVWFIGGAGIYQEAMQKADGSMEEYDHIPGLKEQLSRKIGKLPELKIDSSIKTLDDVMDLLDADTETIMSKFRLENYNPEPFIPFKVAV